MNWKQHLILGIFIQVLLFVILIFNFNFNFVIENLIALCLVLFISPLIMDLDHRHGKLREIITYIGLVISLIGVVAYYFKINLIILMIIGIILSSTAHLTAYITKHRGFMHSIIFCTIYSIIIYFLTYNILLFSVGFIGCYTHLIGDKLFFKIR